MTEHRLQLLDGATVSELLPGEVVPQVVGSRVRPDFPCGFRPDTLDGGSRGWATAPGGEDQARLVRPELVNVALDRLEGAVLRSRILRLVTNDQILGVRTQYPCPMTSERSGVSSVARD
jgi:hypothetical protein